MSKRRHKNRNESSNNENRRMPQPQQPQQRNNTGPFGINPNQLLSMFGNIDMNQINTMLQNMNRDGVDFNNLNLGAIQNLMNGFGGNTNNSSSNTKNAGSINNMNSSANTNDNLQSNMGEEKISGQKLDNKTHTSEKNGHNHKINLDDENIELLRSFRRIVGKEKVGFIDKIIKLYNEGAFND